MITDQNLTKVYEYMDNMIKELDKQCDRVKETNKPGQGK